MTFHYFADKPSIKGKSRNVTAGKGETFNFVCEVLSYPEANVEVYFKPCLPLTQCKDTMRKLLSSNSSAVSKVTFKRPHTLAYAVNEFF